MGRELDAEIATKVMGWRGVRVACMMGPYADLYYRSQTNDGYDVVPSFSSDIAAAWEVVEHVRAMPMSTDEEYQRAAPFKFAWAELYLWNMSAAEAAEAICRAALAAVKGAQG